MIGRIDDDAVLLDLRTRPADDVAIGRSRRSPRRPSPRRVVAAALVRPPGRRTMTVVVGTAGHIDHGKTTLLRALTGIDADRLPEERRRGMTIDVGYAHLRLPDGRRARLRRRPGHDRLVGNMLVGAGEIDAALLVVAADDGPRAQTLEHLELLDALGIEVGNCGGDEGRPRRAGARRGGGCGGGAAVGADVTRRLAGRGGLLVPWRRDRRARRARGGAAGRG